MLMWVKFFKRRSVIGGGLQACWFCEYDVVGGQGTGP